MPLRLPPLATLRIFEAAGRLQSFKLAASELNLTPSAVSHGIVALEKWLQVDLFQRSGRHVALTTAGRNLLPYLTEGLSMIAAGTQRVAGEGPERRVSVSCAATFAARWLVPRLQNFRKLHPKISVAIDTSHRQALFPLDGVDLAIRMGRGPWPGTTSELLLREKLVPVGSPSYLKTLTRGGAVDWTNALLLRVTSIEHDWETWFAGAELDAPEVGVGLYFDTIHLAVDAAACGLGIAMGREPLIAADLASGRVVRASDVTVEIETGYWLAQPAGDDPRREIKAFRNWVLAEAKNGRAAL